jgi:hypothetical protein
MFKLDKKTQGAKSRVLEEIMDMMDGHAGSKLKDLKKPSAVEVSMTSMEPKDGDEDDAKGEMEPMIGGDADDAGDEPSDDEKAQIAALYHKYCK